MIECITDDKLQRILELVELDKQAMDKEALNFILSSKEGRWFLMRLMDRVDLFGSTFSDNPNKSAFNEGRRSVGITILNDIKRLGLDGLRLKQQAETEYAELITESYELRKKLINQSKENEE